MAPELRPPVEFGWLSPLDETTTGSIHHAIPERTFRELTPSCPQGWPRWEFRGRIVRAREDRPDHASLHVRVNRPSQQMEASAEPRPHRRRRISRCRSDPAHPLGRRGRIRRTLATALSVWDVGRPFDHVEHRSRRPGARGVRTHLPGDHQGWRPERVLPRLSVHQHPQYRRCLGAIASRDRDGRARDRRRSEQHRAGSRRGARSQPDRTGVPEPAHPVAGSALVHRDRADEAGRGRSPARYEGRSGLAACLPCSRGPP